MINMIMIITRVRGSDAPERARPTARSAPAPAAEVLYHIILYYIILYVISYVSLLLLLLLYNY